MQAEPSQIAEVTRLNELSRTELTNWLQRALAGEETILHLSPDESPYQGVLRIEATLQSHTRRDLESACRQLVKTFADTGAGEASYLHSLLRLVVELKLKEAAPVLRTLADRTPVWSGLEQITQQRVLGALIDLKVPPPVAFWQTIQAQNPSAFSGLTFSALLMQSQAAAVALLPKLPSNADVASAVPLILGLHWDELDTKARGVLAAQLQAVLPSCNTAIRESLGEWFAEVGIETTPVPTIAVSAVKSHRKLSQRSSTALDSQLDQRLAPVSVGLLNLCARLKNQLPMTSNTAHPCLQ